MLHHDKHDQSWRLERMIEVAGNLNYGDNGRKKARSNIRNILS